MRVLVYLSILVGLTSQAEPVDRIVAIINSEIVTESDVTALQKKLTNNGFIDDLLLFGKTTEDVKKSRPDQLQYLIHERILESEIKRLNLTVTIERVEQEVRDIGKKNGMTRTELLNAVKAQGVSASDYQDFIKSRVERQSLIESEVSAKIRVTDEDLVAQYMRQFPKSDTASFEYTLAHILFNPAKGGEAAAQARATAVLKKIREGQSFDAMAEQNSEDADFSAGGLLGSFKAGEFSKTMESAVTNLSVGDISEVVKSRSGFHILKVLNKKIITDPRFEKEKERIRNVLFEKAFQKNFRTWITQKREEAFVRENPL